MTKQNQSNQIYVSLLGENVDVWRPIKAKKLNNGEYLIEEQPYESDIETWEFKPGDTVICEYLKKDGEQILVAKRKI